MYARMNIQRIITDSLWLIPFLLVFSTVFIVNRELANGLVTGKYFWFYTSMGIASVVTLVYALSNSNKLHFKFTMFDFLIFIFVGSILFSSLVINYASKNATKLTLLVLLTVLYLIFRLYINYGETKELKIIFFNHYHEVG
jgi:hypothetical protein